MRFEPYKVEDEDEEGVVEGVAKFLILGLRPDHFVAGLVKLPGLFIMQYLFFWNWKRIIDPHSWSVVLTGLAVWLAFAAYVVLLILTGGA